MKVTFSVQVTYEVDAKSFARATKKALSAIEEGLAVIEEDEMCVSVSLAQVFPVEPSYEKA